jgi:signal transduction histidine kinase/CheY-like chemotaxis protein
VEDNEAQLLRDRTVELQGLLESLGTNFEAQMGSVAAIAEVTGADIGHFRTAVDGVDPGAATATEGGWALLRRTEAGFVDIATVGSPTAASERPAAWAGGLEAAADGDFTVLGFLGEGLTRTFAMVTGRPGAGGDFVVYNEASLVGATQASAESATPIAGVAIEVFIGSEPDPDQILLSFGTPTDHEEEVVVDISGVDVLLQVSATEPLGGNLASRLPTILLVGGIALGLSSAAVVELTQRRRDDALSTVRDLERKNQLLDQALSDQQATEAARAELEEELHQAHRLEAIGHLAGGVAHDFNNVLAAILSYADLASDSITEPTVQADMESIKSAARRGAALTRQLLQFSRREAGEVSVVDLNERIADVAKMLERTLGEQVTFRTELSPEPALVLADPVELDQVILNLVVNARDALGAGGTIDVRTERVELASDDLSNLSVLGPGTHIRLTVSDDGHGMTPEVLEHAFDPFFTTKGRAQGTGLGLSTVYGIVQRQGGHVVAHSTPGAGTTIEVLLPAGVPVDALPAAEPQPGAVRSLAGRRVLVVEDEAPLRQAMCRMLQRAGFEVLDAQDGRAAMARLDADIDLLLTDIVMPGSLTGVEVADGFRARTSDLPVVFVTGYSDDILDPSRLEGPTPTMLLTKPFTEADLLEAVGVAMGSMG